MACSRGLLVGFSCTAMLLCAPVAASAQSAPDYATAYNHAVRCFAVSSINRDRAGARPAFDAAVRLGQLQGMTSAEVKVALDYGISREAENIRRDASYKGRTLAQCRKLGWAT